VQAVYAKKALKYMVLPGIAPRINQMFASGFGPLAYLVARIYGMAKLLPPNHPYLNQQNIGRFGLRNVVAEAANNLIISRKTIDQMIIFVAVLTGIFLLAAQFVLLGYMLFVGQAHAQISSMFGESIFDTPDPTNDIALGMLDRVFGVPGMFCNVAGKCTTVNATLPTPMHVGLQSLFEFYSYAMLLVGVLIFLYFVVVVVAETAVSGTPFGQRFQNVWVPIRLVVALGLLVPINYGYNSGQYLALYSAKMGSALATNGWLRFNQVMGERMGDNVNPTGETKEAMVGIPKGQSIAGLVQAMSLVHTCAYGEWLQATRGLRGAGYSPASGFYIKPYFVKNPQADGGDVAPNMEVTNGTTYLDALNFYNDADIIIRFGEYNTDKYPSEAGNVLPTCGEIRIPVGSVANKGRAEELGGPDHILKTYFDVTKSMWFDEGDAAGGGALKAGAIRFNEVGNLDPTDKEKRSCAAAAPGLATDSSACYEVSPGSLWKQSVINHYREIVDPKILEAWQKYVAYKQDFTITQDILKFGWGGSAIWYNKIAEVNGTFLSAALNVPLMVKYPIIMEKVQELKQKYDASPDNNNLFIPNFSQDNGRAAAVDLLGDAGSQRATVLGTAYGVWAQDGSDQTTGEKQVVGNIFRDAMSMVLGVEGIFKIRGENAHVHPLAQLSMIGKGMVEHTIRNMAISNTTAFMGGMMASMGNASGGGLIKSVGNIFSSTAFLGMTAGVTLYYVLPFLPFIYFFFAVGAWVKSVFEAMVGIPLWALAHLRLDGEGLAGDSASSGYFLIFEIGLRPILIVFGLIAALLIFTAQVRILNYVWDLVTANAAGFSDNAAFTVGAAGVDKSPSFKRDVVEQFGHTVIYTIIVYMLANSSFKLIDLIPNEALRWLGSGATSYASKEQNSAAQVSSYVSSAGLVQGQTLAGSLQGFSEGAGRFGGAAIEEVGGGAGKVIGQVMGLGGRQ
jgi:conjugal transfer/type IV secretion protein DotA/TraY